MEKSNGDLYNNIVIIPVIKAAEVFKTNDIVAQKLNVVVVAAMHLRKEKEGEKKGWYFPIRKFVTEIGCG